MKSSKFKPRGRGEGVAVLCSWARHLTPIESLSTQDYIHVTANWQGSIKKSLVGGSCGVMLCGVV